MADHARGVRHVIAVRSAAILAAALFTAACTSTPPRFTHGVASGDMTGESAVLWTRASMPATLIPELSTTPGFEGARALAPVTAATAADLTAKALAVGLEPDSAPCPPRLIPGPHPP